MNISSAIASPSLFEPREHPSGCQCPGCCKEDITSSLQDTSDGVNESINIEEEKSETQETGKSDTKNENELTASERQQVSQLQQRDAEVRAHEGAHIAAGGSAVSGGASFTYQKGPDGKQYAVGGEVPISTSGGNTPEEKIALARQVQAGALAPANPSPQDLKVASSAALMEAQARQDLAIEKSEEVKEKEVGVYEDNQKETQRSNIDDTPTIELFA